jgi:hypothetical protein
MLTIWNQITTEFYGRRISAAYVIEDGMLKEFSRVEARACERTAVLLAASSDARFLLI